MHGAYLILAALYRKLVRFADGLFCFCGEMIEWRHEWVWLVSKYYGVAACLVSPSLTIE